MFSRFVTIHECYGHTDGQTDLNGIATTIKRVAFMAECGRVIKMSCINIHKSFQYIGIQPLTQQQLILSLCIESVWEAVLLFIPELRTRTYPTLFCAFSVWISVA